MIVSREVEMLVDLIRYFCHPILRQVLPSYIAAAPKPIKALAWIVKTFNLDRRMTMKVRERFRIQAAQVGRYPNVPWHTTFCISF